MQNTNWIKEMSTSEFAERKKTCDTVIIPVGATEGYGPHLPLASDTFVACKIAELVAEQTGAMIGPTLEIGESYSLSMYPGTMCLTPQTWTAVFNDIMDSLIKWGFRYFMIINGHAGNVPLIGHVVRRKQNECGVKCAQIDWWRFAQKFSNDVCENKGFMAHGHASECGGSVMLYLYPEMVDMSKARRVEPERESYVRDSDLVTYVSFAKTTQCGILGDATVATLEKGEKIVTRAVDRIVEYMKTEF